MKEIEGLESEVGILEVLEVLEEEEEGEADYT